MLCVAATAASTYSAASSAANNSMSPRDLLAAANDAVRRELKRSGEEAFDSYVPRFLGYVQDRDIYIAAFDALKRDEDDNIVDASFAVYCTMTSSGKLRVLHIDSVFEKICGEEGSVLDKLPVWAYDCCTPVALENSR